MNFFREELKKTTGESVTSLHLGCYYYKMVSNIDYYHQKVLFRGHLVVSLLKSPLKVEVKFLAANTNIYTEKDSIQC